MVGQQTKSQKSLTLELDDTNSSNALLRKLDTLVREQVGPLPDLHRDPHKLSRNRYHNDEDDKADETRDTESNDQDDERGNNPEEK